MPEQAMADENREEASQKEASGERLIAGNDLHCPGRRERFRGTWRSYLYLFRTWSDNFIEADARLAGTAQRHTRGVHRFTAAMALRSMHGTCTCPATGSHVRPRLCSMAISAAMHTCAGLAPNSSARPAAAIEHATPTSPAADFGTRNRGVHLIKRTNGAGYQQVTRQ